MVIHQIQSQFTAIFYQEDAVGADMVAVWKKFYEQYQVRSAVSGQLPLPFVWDNKI